MTGSSGASGGGFGGGGEIACELLKFEAQIASPNPTVVATLSVNDELGVVIASSSGVQEIQVKTSSGAVAGGLLANRVQRLRECILHGTRYKARVILINLGQVRVYVEPV